jgi:hypothetical protein
VPRYENRKFINEVKYVVSNPLSGFTKDLPSLVLIVTPLTVRCNVNKVEQALKPPHKKWKNNAIAMPDSKSTIGPSSSGQYLQRLSARRVRSHHHTAYQSLTRRELCACGRCFGLFLYNRPSITSRLFSRKYSSTYPLLVPIISLACSRFIAGFSE